MSQYLSFVDWSPFYQASAHGCTVASTPWPDRHRCLDWPWVRCRGRSRPRCSRLSSIGGDGPATGLAGSHRRSGTKDSAVVRDAGLGDLTRAVTPYESGLSLRRMAEQVACDTETVREA
jgi:hypothetical protein